jgi:hypothetical protein
MNYNNWPVIGRIDQQLVALIKIMSDKLKKDNANNALKNLNEYKMNQKIILQRFHFKCNICFSNCSLIVRFVHEA